MKRIYCIFTKFGIFGWMHKWSDKPVKETKHCKCIEYIKCDDAKLTWKDIQDITYLIDEAKINAPESSEQTLYRWVSTTFNKGKFSV